MSGLLWQVPLFIGCWILIFFAADLFIDGLKDLGEKHSLSPFILGILILGIDPEESVASIIAASQGLPHLAIGNVIGNTIIALTITFGLPALFYAQKFERISGFYPILLIVLAVNILIGCLVPGGLLIFGIINLLLFGWYLVRNFKEFRIHGVPEIQINDAENSEWNGSDEVNVEAFNEQEGEKQKETEQEESDASLILKTVFGIFLVIIGGFGLIYATEGIVTETGISESLFGFLIIAFATNVEELALILISIKKNRVAIGIGAEVGKVIWNLAFTFGVSGIFLVQVRPTPIYLFNFIVLFLTLGFFWGILQKRQLTRPIGVIFLSIFILFVVVNILAGGLVLD